MTMAQAEDEGARAEDEGAARGAGGQDGHGSLRALIVDDEPLAVARIEALCSRIEGVEVIGSASDGETALALVRESGPDLVLLDMTMPGMGGLEVARALMASQQGGDAGGGDWPSVIFVTAHEDFAVEAFDLDAVDYVLKPVAQDRLERAIARVLARRRMPGSGASGRGAPSQWIEELWVPHRSELLRIALSQVSRIDAERDYVRLHVEDSEGLARSYLLLQTITGLERRLDPDRFIRIHRSTILRKDRIRGLRHDGLGVWSVELEDGDTLRIGRTFLPRVKQMAGR